MRLDQSEQLRHPALRHDDVVVELERRDRPSATSESSRRTRHSSSRSLVAGRAQHLGRAGVAAGLLHASRLRGDLLRQAVDLDQQERARARPAPARARSRYAATASSTRRRSARAPPARRARAISRVTASTAACGTSANVARSVALRRRLRDQPQDDLRDDRQRALRADQQLRQVVADDVLDHLAAGPDRSRRSAARPRGRARTACVTPYLNARGPPAHSATLPPMTDCRRLAGSGG